MPSITMPCPGVCKGAPAWRSPTGLWCSCCSGTGKEPNPREMFRPARMGAKNFAAKVRREKDARERRRTDYLATLPSRCAS